MPWISVSPVTYTLILCDYKGFRCCKNEKFRSSKVAHSKIQRMCCFFKKLVYREEEREMNPLCLDQGVGLIPWSPLARGFLTGNRTRDDLDMEKNKTSATKRAQTDAFGHRLYYADSDFEIVERLKTVAEKKKVKPAQLALAWILSKPGVCAPIIGASKMYQLEEAVASTNIQLSDEEIKSLQELYQPHRILGHS